MNTRLREYNRSMDIDEDAYPHRFEEDRFPSYYDCGGVWMQRRRSRVDDAYWVFDQSMVAITTRYRSQPATEELIVEVVELMHEAAEEAREEGDEQWMDLVQWDAGPWMDCLFDIRSLREFR